MRVDTVKTYRISVSDLKKLLGIPQEEVVQSVHSGTVIPGGAIDIMTSTRYEQVDLS